MAAVVAALQAAATYPYFVKETDALGKSPYRERLTAAATFEQLEMIANALAIDSNDRLLWLLESPHDR